MWRFFIDVKDYGRKNRLLASKSDGNGRMTIAKVTFESVDDNTVFEDDESAVLFAARKDEMKQFLQGLVDTAWDVYRISPGQSQGAGAAQSAHLQDMRALVAKVHDVKLPGIEE